MAAGLETTAAVERDKKDPTVGKKDPTAGKGWKFVDG
jgi:hypothetical protein